MQHIGQADETNRLGIIANGRAQGFAGLQALRTVCQGKRPGRQYQVTEGFPGTGAVIPCIEVKGSQAQTQFLPSTDSASEHCRQLVSVQASQRVAGMNNDRNAIDANDSY